MYTTVSYLDGTEPIDFLIKAEDVDPLTIYPSAFFPLNLYDLTLYGSAVCDP